MHGNYLSTKEVISIKRSMSARTCCGQSFPSWPPGVPQVSSSFHQPLLTDVTLAEAGGICNHLVKDFHTQD